MTFKMTAKKTTYELSIDELKELIAEKLGTRADRVEVNARTGYGEQFIGITVVVDEKEAYSGHYTR